MSADERLAIWRYATPEERQRVIDGAWVAADAPEEADYLLVNQHECCPWGAAFGGYEQHADCEFVGLPLASGIAEQLKGRVPYDEAHRLAYTFTDAWDRGKISRDDLIAYLRQLNAQEAAQSGQATVWLAAGTWLAFVIACALVAGCVYGAQWITLIWLAPWGGW